MVLNSIPESQNDSCQTLVEKSASKTSNKSNKSSKSNKSKASNDFEVPKNGKVASLRLRFRSKTADGTEMSLTKVPVSGDYALESGLLSVITGKSDVRIPKTEIDPIEEECKQGDILTSVEKRIQSTEMKIREAPTRKLKKVLIYENPTDTFSKLYGLNNAERNVRSDLSTGSEIPKSRLSSKINSKQKRNTLPSKLPVKVALKGLEAEQIQTDIEQDKPNEEKVKKDKKDGKEVKDDKIRNALQENFSSLVPLYESELKKIMDTWVNTIYCSMMMRANLVRLLFKSLPSLNRSQFQKEDETILECVDRAKTYTRSQAENLIQFIKLLMVNRNKVKEDYILMMSNKQIAESYNHNWKALTKKITRLGDDIKQLQTDIPEIEKKKENYEATANEKIQKMELNLSKREEEIEKLSTQLNILKYQEKTFNGTMPALKGEDYKDIKEEVVSLKSVEREFEELKAKYMCQNNIFEKKIKDLESLLEEKKKTLKREKEMKNQMQSFLVQLQSHEKLMCRRMGKEQVDFVLGRSLQSKNKRREQLLVSAVKLVLKGFIVQMKILERDKNKMLLELSSNDVVNYNSLATAIIQKDNFIKSIRHQMNAFHTASKHLTTKNSESSVL